MLRILKFYLKERFFRLGLMKLQHIFSLVNDNYTLIIKAVKRIATSNDANLFLRSLEFADAQSKKYVILGE